MIIYPSGSGRHVNPSTVIIASTLLVLCSFALFSRIQKLKNGHDWDLLIFTQHWPNTVCMEWVEQDPPNKCSFPKTPDLWTIHGVWPTKLGTRGPVFCNSSYHFNATALDAIRDDLNEYWKDVEHKNHNAFWKHEWLKHGTCSTTDQYLQTELAYFKQALTWSKKYNMHTILTKMNIEPSDTNEGIEVTRLSDAVHSVIGKNARIECVHDVKTGLPYLSEIRICFDKNLTLTDCDGTKTGYGQRYGSGHRSWWARNVITNCPQDKPIMYPKSVPSWNRRPPAREPDHYLVTIFKILQMLSWVTS